MLELSSLNSATGEHIPDIYPWLIGGWAIACGYVDLTQRRIPNSLTLGAVVLAVLILLLHGHNALGFPVMSAITAFLVALTLTLPAYVVRWIGAGDVKMLAAMALLVGFQLLLLSYLFAVVLALLILIACRSVKHHLPYLNNHLQACGLEPFMYAGTGKRFIPFGSCLAVGLLLSLLIFSLQPALLS
ncbi:peptidase A24A, prepilin type IV [Methylophaga lonarensis MPL]|uniref:Peptidase A24A, prepilin type IV n=1 Tax=Methylophaga lonarensis MPL TaxID=1286106 RepID=M7PP46_9GAMM|nr:A24 family peptidase [Methylophaga lonarensis]EMR12229.1 peptidase A24A, prepilin type IV [Methylophaga lonarensis MPL]